MSTSSVPNEAESASLFAPSGSGGPTVLRILLGTQLRRLRVAKDITRKDAGYAIRASQAKISRLELGRVSFKERDVADLLTLYGVSDKTEREPLLALARQANSPGWWHRYSDILPQWFEVYIGLEEAASIIRCYELQFLPGLLQTPEYARAVIMLGHGAAPGHEIDRRVALRTKRAERLTGPGAPTFWAVIDEAALRRPFGGRDVMRAQLDHLIEVNELPNVQVQIMPFDRGGHAAAGGPFAILRFAEAALPDVVYLEQLTSALYLDKREDIENYIQIMDRLSVQANNTSDTKGFLTRLRRDL